MRLSNNQPVVSHYVKYVQEWSVLGWGEERGWFHLQEAAAKVILPVPIFSPKPLSNILSEYVEQMRSRTPKLSKIYNVIFAFAKGGSLVWNWYCKY